MVKPFLGETDSVWGTKATLTLQDFYDIEYEGKKSRIVNCYNNTDKGVNNKDREK